MRRTFRLPVIAIVSFCFCRAGFAATDLALKDVATSPPATPPAKAAVPRVDMERVCPDIWLTHSIDPGLSDIEKNLICGEKKAQFSPAWSHVPRAQALFHLRTFLQSRGYFQPLIPDGAYSSQDALVDPGPLSYVREIQVEGISPPIEISRKREIIGTKLTPDVLNRTETWVAQRVHAAGHPCSTVRSEADPVTGLIRVAVDPGPYASRVSVVEENTLEGLPAGITSRYFAFDPTEPYNGDMITLTEKRIISSKTVQSIHFVTVGCESDEVQLQQNVVVGPPRLLSFGLGANTEGLLLARASWRNTRLGRTASSFEITALVSARERQLTSYLNWYHLPYPSRRYLQPLVQVRNQNEKFYEVFNPGTALNYGTSWDNNTLGLAFQAGPALDYITTLRGPGPSESHFVSLESRLALASHYYEFYQNSPRAGFQTTFTTAFSDRNIFSTVSAQRLRLLNEFLWNLNQYDPPLLIMGLRSFLSTTVTAERPETSAKLPPTFRYYLGGSADLRGFGRQELPASGVGALSAAVLSLELRYGLRLPLGLQPIAFLDAGMLGDLPFMLRYPLYWSPGVGFRWESPIGVVRGTAAHGYVAPAPADTPLSHWQFFISLGEEF